jgi:hypothetical protein
VCHELADTNGARGGQQVSVPSVRNRLVVAAIRFTCRKFTGPLSAVS